VKVKTIAMRFNVNPTVGFGHFVRCNEIAYHLKKSDCNVIAILDQYSSISTNSPIFFDNTFTLPTEQDALSTAEICVAQKAEALLVDHYHCDQNYQEQLNRYPLYWGQFDYKCSGSYLGDFLININLTATSAWYNDCQLSKKTSLLLGCKYAVIKHALTELPANTSSEHNGNIFFSLGAGNDNDLYQTIAPLLLTLPSLKNLHLCCSSTCQSIGFLRVLAKKNTKLKLHINSNNIEKVMQQCTFGVISGGTLTYELATLGIPFACGYVAANQIKLCQGWHQKRSMLNLGDLSQFSVDDLQPIEQQITKINLSQLKQSVMNDNDGLGASRIAQQLVEAK
jgi:UDP-2,4-diacetamido-2,4,6-trideoxy-beta-L-altropyranose hydrolase